MIIVNRHWFGGLATVKKLGHGLQWLLKRTEQIWPSLVWMGKDFEHHQRMIVIQNESFFNLFLWLKLLFISDDYQGQRLRCCPLLDQTQSLYMLCSGMWILLTLLSSLLFSLPLLGEDRTIPSQSPACTFLCICGCFIPGSKLLLLKLSFYCPMPHLVQPHCCIFIWFNHHMPEQCSQIFSS